MKYDYENGLLKVQKLKKLFLIISIFVSLIFVGLVTTFILLSSYETRILYKAIGIPTLFLILCLNFYLYINCFNFYRQEEAGLYNILYGYKSDVEGVLVAINDNVHLPIYKKGYEIVVKTDKGEVSLYVPNIFEKPTIELNIKIKLETAKSFILSYEVKK